MGDFRNFCDGALQLLSFVRVHVPSPLFPFSEKRFQRLVHFPFFPDDARLEPGRLNVPVRRHERAGAVVLVHFAVTEHVALLEQPFDQLHAPFVVRRQIVAVRKVKRINVVKGGGIPLFDQFERLLVRRRANRAAAFPFAEKLLLAHFFRFRMMGDKHDVDFIVFRPQKTDHPEKETARHIFFETAHRTGGGIMNESGRFMVCSIRKIFFLIEKLCRVIMNALTTLRCAGSNRFPSEGRVEVRYWRAPRQ